MTLPTNMRIAFRALRINKLRSTLTMLGIIFGVSSVIATVAVGVGAQNRVQEEIRGIGSNIIVVSPGSANSSGVRMGAGSRMTITDADAATIQAEVPSVVVASPLLRGSGQAVYANANWTSPVFGVTPQYLTARDWAVVDGRPLEQEDIDGSRKVALIGRTVADRLFLGADPIDAVIRIDRVPFRVVGVLDRKGQSMGGQDMDDVILMPLTTARTRLLGRIQANARLVTQISVKVREGTDMNAAMNEIGEAVRAKHRLQPWQDNDFTLRNISDILKAKEETSRVMTLFLTAVASVSLLVGGVGIMNVMLVSVTERTREIGLRMAMGAKGRDIMLQFLVEAVTLAMVGGLIGVAVGVAGSMVIGEFGGFRVDLDPNGILIALSFSFLSGVVFGFLPARKAALLDPIEALRFE
jgi:putative ABC transport system permease protein